MNDPHTHPSKAGACRWAATPTRALGSSRTSVLATTRPVTARRTARTHRRSWRRCASSSIPVTWVPWPPRSLLHRPRTPARHTRNWQPRPDRQRSGASRDWARSGSRAGSGIASCFYLCSGSAACVGAAGLRRSRDASAPRW